MRSGTELEKERDTKRALSDAQESILQLGPVALKRLRSYVELRAEDEISRCAILDDDMHLRRAQGSSSAWLDVLELLSYEPVETRRSKSRREV